MSQRSCPPGLPGEPVEIDVAGEHARRTPRAYSSVKERTSVTGRRPVTGPLAEVGWPSLSSI